MKALSLWQPWATLVVLGLKKFETRSWPTSHRGQLVIHAGSRVVDIDDVPVALLDKLAAELKRDASQLFLELPRGALVGTVNVEDCRPTESTPVPDPFEFVAGDWLSGRFAWALSRHRRFAEPVPYLGRQGLFEVFDQLLPREGGA